MDDDDIDGSVREEILLARTARDRWHAGYLGYSYRLAVDLGLALVENRPLDVLKTDLWNECVGGERDILGHLQALGSCRTFGIDIAHRICAGGRSRVPLAHVVQADITALPFRTGSLDAVVDLSTLDHLPEAEVARAIGEYRRVLRDRGILLVVFWNRNLAIRLRLLCKRLLGRPEKPDQRYFGLASVRAALGDGLTAAREFVAGLLLVPPFALTGTLLGRLRPERLERLLWRLVRIEHSRAARPLLRHVAGLYGIVAVRRRGAPNG